MALAILTLDVAANSDALFGMDIEVLARNLVMQTAFLGFVAGSIAFVWPGSEALDRSRPEWKNRPDAWS